MNNLKQKYLQFMRGRYGADIFSRDLMWFTLVLVILNIFIKSKILSFVPILIFGFIYFRLFSKNFSKRYNENRIYTNIKAKVTRPFKNSIQRIKDFRKFKYFKCPNCTQKLRVPRGRGEIVITCRRCKTKFDGKS